MVALPFFLRKGVALDAGLFMQSSFCWNQGIQLLESCAPPCSQCLQIREHIWFRSGVSENGEELVPRIISLQVLSDSTTFRQKLLSSFEFSISYEPEGTLDTFRFIFSAISKNVAGRPKGNMGGATWEVLGLRPVKYVPENGMEGLSVSEGISTLLKKRGGGGLKGL